MERKAFRGINIHMWGSLLITDLYVINAGTLGNICDGIEGYLEDFDARYSWQRKPNSA